MKLESHIRISVLFLQILLIILILRMWFLKAVASGKCQRGILICGTGIGMSIVANKHNGIRAAVCESSASAKLSREHNDANILCLGARISSWETAAEIVKTFLTTPFSGGERHYAAEFKRFTLLQVYKILINHIQFINHFLIQSHI